jgi:hypothetical protein
MIGDVVYSLPGFPVIVSEVAATIEIPGKKGAGSRETGYTAIRAEIPQDRAKTRLDGSGGDSGE